MNKIPRTILLCALFICVGCGGDDNSDTSGTSDTTATGTTDEGTTDEGTTDGGTTDEGTTDEGTTDEGTTDEGTTDEGTTDEGTTDEGTTDEGTTDEGTTDEGTTDEGTTDEGTTDEGTTDEGTTDGSTTSGSGESCEEAIAVNSAPFSAQGDTAKAIDSYSFPDNACPGEELGWGLDAPDMVYAFTPPKTGIYVINLAPQYDSALYVVGDCEDIGNQCLGANDELGVTSETLTLNLSQTQTYFIIVDGYGTNAKGEFELNISEACVPNCDGKKCGDNGCGLPCGLCNGEQEICVDNQCAQASSECSAVAALACDQTLTALSTAYAGATYAFDDYSCNSIYPAGAYAQSPELTHSFSAAQNTRVTVKGINDASLNAVVLEDTGSGCVDNASNCLKLGYGQVIFDAAAGQDYFVVWDSPSAEKNYDFGMQVSCCTLNCDGNSCGGDDGCGGTCGCSGAATCFNGSCCTPTCDGVSCNNGDGCGGACGCPGGTVCDDGSCTQLTNSCEPKTSVKCGDQLTDLSNLNANSSMAFSDYPCQISGNNSYDESPEVVYEFTAVDDTTVTVQGSNESSLDVTILKDLGGGCEATTESCVAQKTSTVSFDAKQGEVFYIVWDSWSGKVVDGFTMNVSCCQKQCDGVNCGQSDGCSGTCGCANGQSCSTAGKCCTTSCDGSSWGGPDGCGGTCNCQAGTTCAPSSACDANSGGDTCGTAFPVTEGELITGDTSCAFSNTYSTQGACDAGSNLGVLSPDVVHSFTPATSGDYILSMPNYKQGKGASVVYVTSDCGDFAQGCVGAIDFYFGKTLSLSLSAGVTYFVVVDSFIPSEAGAFAFQIDKK